MIEQKKENKDNKLVKYTDENIFGIKFSKKAKHIKCAIDYLTLNHLVNKDGKLKSNMYDKIRLRYIWQYLVYIRNNNKELKIFKEHLGVGYAIKAQKYFELIKLETTGDIKNHTMTKKELKLFITKLFNLYKNLNIPFLDWYKNVAPIKREKKVKKKRKYKKREKVIKKESEIKFPDEIKTEIKIITDGDVTNSHDEGNIKIKLQTNVIKTD